MHGLKHEQGRQRTAYYWQRSVRACAGTNQREGGAVEGEPGGEQGVGASVKTLFVTQRGNRFVLSRPLGSLPSALSFCQ